MNSFVYQNIIERKDYIFLPHQKKSTTMTGDWTTLLSQLAPEVLSGLASRIIGRIPKIQFGKVLTDEELAKLSSGKRNILRFVKPQKRRGGVSCL